MGDKKCFTCKNTYPHPIYKGYYSWHKLHGNYECLHCYGKRYRQSHKKEATEYSMVYRQKNKEVLKKKAIIYKNRPSVRQHMNKYWREYRRRPEVIKRKRDRMKDKSHVEKYRETRRKYDKRTSIKQAEQAKQRLLKLSSNLNMNTSEYMYAYIKWAKAVKERDSNTCQICYGKPQTLHAHHLFYKAYNPQLSLNINNGITLCKSCHREAHGVKFGQ